MPADFYMPIPACGKVPGRDKCVRYQKSQNDTRDEPFIS